MANHRIGREESLAQIVRTIARRSSCPRREVGAILVRDGRVFSQGYNGAPAGLPHCLEVGCDPAPDGGCQRTVHAEANAIAFAARYGIATQDATLWTTVSPCISCAKLIINAGIEIVFFIEGYRDMSGLNLLSNAGIVVYHYIGVGKEYGT